MIPHSALSDDIAGEEVKLLKNWLMICNCFTNFTKFSEQNERNHKRIFLTKVFAELFSKSDRVPRRHTNEYELAKFRMFFLISPPPTTALFLSNSR